MILEFLNHKWIQMFLVIAILFGLAWVIGLNISVNIGASGFDFAITRV